MPVEQWVAVRRILMTSLCLRILEDADLSLSELLDDREHGLWKQFMNGSWGNLVFFLKERESWLEALHEYIDGGITNGRLKQASEVIYLIDPDATTNFFIDFLEAVEQDRKEHGWTINDNKKWKVNVGVYQPRNRKDEGLIRQEYLHYRVQEELTGIHEDFLVVSRLRNSPASVLGHLSGWIALASGSTNEEVETATDGKSIFALKSGETASSAEDSSSPEAIASLAPSSSKPKTTTQESSQPFATSVATPPPITPSHPSNRASPSVSTSGRRIRPAKGKASSLLKAFAKEDPRVTKHRNSIAVTEVVAATQILNSHPSMEKFFAALKKTDPAAAVNTQLFYERIESEKAKAEELSRTPIQNAEPVIDRAQAAPSTPIQDAGGVKRKGEGSPEPENGIKRQKPAADVPTPLTFEVLQLEGDGRRRSVKLLIHEQDYCYMDIDALSTASGRRVWTSMASKDIPESTIDLRKMGYALRKGPVETVRKVILEGEEVLESTTSLWTLDKWVPYCIVVDALEVTDEQPECLARFRSWLDSAQEHVGMSRLVQQMERDRQCAGLESLMCDKVAAQLEATPSSIEDYMDQVTNVTVEVKAKMQQGLTAASERMRARSSA